MIEGEKVKPALILVVDTTDCQDFSLKLFKKVLDNQDIFVLIGWGTWSGELREWRFTN